MAYEDWSEGYQELFDLSTDYLSDYLSPEDLETAQELFEDSFVPEFIDADYTWLDIRGEDFFDFLGLAAEMFDWDLWRELYE